MAKKQFVGVQTFGEDVSDPKPSSVSGSGPGRYRVSLECPTPLAHQSYEVEAETPEQAQSAFNAANGISGSEHSYTVVKVG